MAFPFRSWYRVVLEAEEILRKEKDNMLKCDRDEQWAESLSL